MAEPTIYMDDVAAFTFDEKSGLVKMSIPSGGAESNFVMSLNTLLKLGEAARRAARKAFDELKEPEVIPFPSQEPQRPKRSRKKAAT